MSYYPGDSLRYFSDDNDEWPAYGTSEVTTTETEETETEEEETTFLPGGALDPEQDEALESADPFTRFRAGGDFL